MATAAVHRARAWGRPARIALIALAVVAILFLFVFPTRSYLDQRTRVNDARHDVQVLQEQNRRLQEEADRLGTPEEVERLAREEFQMVYPGERAYAVLPAPETTTTTVP